MNNKIHAWKIFLGFLLFLFVTGYEISCGSKNSPSSPSTPTEPTATVTATATPVDLDVTAPTTLIAGEYHYGHIHIQAGGVLYLQGVNAGNSDAAVTLDCDDYFLLDSGASIIGDATGYHYADGPGKPGPTSSSGAGHGGLGGMDNSSNPGGPINDNAMGPTIMGSGSNGGAGGALFRLNVAPLNAATLNGVISVNGGPFDLTRGGGAGGSVYIQAGYIFGSGFIKANGDTGTTANGGGGGGGGGIVVLSIRNGYDFTGTVQVNGGSSGGGEAQSGGIGIFNVTSY